MVIYTRAFQSHFSVVLDESGLPRKGLQVSYWGFKTVFIQPAMLLDFGNGAS